MLRAELKPGAERLRGFLLLVLLLTDFHFVASQANETTTAAAEAVATTTTESPNITPSPNVTEIPVFTPKPGLNASRNLSAIETTSLFVPITTPHVPDISTPAPTPQPPVYYVTFIYRIPLSAEEFTAAKQTLYLEAVAAVVELPLELVSITAIVGVSVRRRSSANTLRQNSNAVDVTTKVMVPNGVDPELIQSKLTAAALAAALNARDASLAGTYTKAPTFGDEPVPCGLPTHQCSAYTRPSLFAPAPTTKPENVSVAPDEEPEGTDLGPCICDLTERVCDANCECDEECLDTEREVFSTEYGVPLKQENAPEQLPICTSSDTFLAINSPMRLENSPLCVTLNNNPSVGNFFVPPGASVLNDKVRVEFNSLGVGPWIPYEPEEVPDSGTYKVGMRMRIAYGREESPDQPGLFGDFDFLSLPYPGSSGRCTLGNFVQYWDGTQEPGPCSQGGPKDEFCTGSSMLSATRYVQNLFIAARPPGMELAEWSGVDGWVSVALDISVVDRTGASESSYTTSNLPKPYFDGFTNRCVNVLESLHYVLVRDGNGQVRSAKALVSLTHVPPQEDGSINILQNFGVRFLDIDTAGLDTELEQATIDRSGNPGYRDGLPVLAGFINTEAPENPEEMPASIEEMLGGLAIPRMSGPDGMCVVCPEGSGSAWSCSSTPDASDSIPVLFNENLQHGCMIKLTRSQLQSFCRPNQIHPLLTYDERLRIGIWGQADTRNYFDWLPNDENQEQLADTDDDPTAEQAFDPRGDCQNVVDSIHYQFLTADVGNVKNPQSKILGARITYGRTNWLAQHPDFDTPAFYQLKTSVSFVRLEDGGSVDVIPDPPSILPMLPDDIFYPFLTNAAPPLNTQLPLTIWASGLCALWLLLRSWP